MKITWERRNQKKREEASKMAKKIMNTATMKIRRNLKSNQSGEEIEYTASYHENISNQRKAESHIMKWNHLTTSK